MIEDKSDRKGPAYFLSRVLYERMCKVMAKARRINKVRNAQCSATKTAQYNNVIHRRDTETILTLKGKALCSIKLVIYGPNLG